MDTKSRDKPATGDTCAPPVLGDRAAPVPDHPDRSGPQKTEVGQIGEKHETEKKTSHSAASDPKITDAGS